MILEHRHLIVRSKITKPLTDPEKAKEFIKRIIAGIGMQLAIGLEANPIAYYCNLDGNNGLTAAAILETSHCAMHIWDEDEPATLQFDLYSCHEFDIETIKPFFEELGIVEGTNEYFFINRDDGLKIISEGKIS